MALESGFFNSVGGDRLYNADDMSRYFEHILSNGIFKRINRCLEVSPAGGMTLAVAAGAGLINCRWFRAASAETVTIPAAHAVLPRFDVVVARLDMSDSVRWYPARLLNPLPSLPLCARRRCTTWRWRWFTSRQAQPPSRRRT